MTRRLEFFLGGHDLEMREVRKLIETADAGLGVHDKGLRWGARASSYLAEIEVALVSGTTPVLVELEDDLPASVPRAQLIMIDHHGEAAGHDRPGALRQVFELLSGQYQLEWTRWHELVQVNDIGHIAGLRAMGASPAEIRTVRDADRAAQGITGEIEARSREAIRSLRMEGRLGVIHTDLDTASAMTDFLEPEYGGSPVENLLVLMPGKAAFYGVGAAILAMRDWPGCWYGGALPERGYWGALASREQQEEIKAGITEAVGERKERP